MFVRLNFLLSVEGRIRPVRRVSDVCMYVWTYVCIRTAFLTGRRVERERDL